jgi:GT2 family glycosyltransferase
VTPLVRVVVVTRDGGQLLERCLECLAKVDWPADRLDVVIVDNASIDGSVERAVAAHPARVIRADHNLGFAAGNNLALTDLGDVEFVALLNNDAFVERDWLRPLVSALEAEPTLGAATSKVLFAPRYLECHLDGPITVRGVRVEGEDRWRETHFAEGWDDPDFDPEAGSPYRRAEASATLWIPASSDRRAELLLDDGWTAVTLMGEPFDVVNNVGSILLPRGHAADRGFLQRDEGQFESPQEVFAWSGTSVLLRPAYLEQVGLFDPRLFAYYEDLDLSWRGRTRGWRYLYVPGSVVRHAHAATSIIGSELFDYHVERNRLLVAVKNAPASYALGAVGESLRVTGLHVRRDVLNHLRRRERPTTTFLRRRARAFGGFLRGLPSAVRARDEVLPETEVERWLEQR